MFWITAGTVCLTISVVGLLGRRWLNREQDSEAVEEDGYPIED